MKTTTMGYVGFGGGGCGTKYPRGSMYPIIRYLGFWVIVIIV